MQIRQVIVVRKVYIYFIAQVQVFVEVRYLSLLSVRNIQYYSCIYFPFACPDSKIQLVALRRCW